MKIKNWVFLLTAVFIFSISLSIFSFSQKPFQGFILSLPEEIVGEPGETIEVQGTILNFGIFWLHNFDLWLTGLPEGIEFNITPSHFDDVRILRDWTPEKGVFRVPENFTLTIKIPENASGLWPANLTGQEKFSWRQAANSTLSILKIAGAARITASEIEVPEMVAEGIPFEVSLNVNNEGAVDTQTNVSVDIPSDWNVEEKTKSVSLAVNSSEKVTFSITPTTSAGNISVNIDYPIKATVITFTKSGPYLEPLPREELPVSELPAPTGGVQLPSISGLIIFVQTYSTIIIIVGIVILAIILWNVAKLYEVKNVRKKPEEF